MWIQLAFAWLYVVSQEPDNQFWPNWSQYNTIVIARAYFKNQASVYVRRSIMYEKAAFC